MRLNDGPRRFDTRRRLRAILEQESPGADDLFRDLDETDPADPERLVHDMAIEQLYPRDRKPRPR